MNFKNSLIIISFFIASYAQAAGDGKDQKPQQNSNEKNVNKKSKNLTDAQKEELAKRREEVRKQRDKLLKIKEAGPQIAKTEDPQLAKTEGTQLVVQPQRESVNNLVIKKCNANISQQQQYTGLGLIIRPDTNVDQALKKNEDATKQCLVQKPTPKTEGPQLVVQPQGEQKRETIEDLIIKKGNTNIPQQQQYTGLGLIIRPDNNVDHVLNGIQEKIKSNIDTQNEAIKKYQLEGIKIGNEDGDYFFHFTRSEDTEQHHVSLGLLYSSKQNLLGKNQQGKVFDQKNVDDLKQIVNDKKTIKTSQLSLGNLLLFVRKKKNGKTNEIYGEIEDKNKKIQKIEKLGADWIEKAYIVAEVTGRTFINEWNTVRQNIQNKNFIFEGGGTDFFPHISLGTITKHTTHYDTAVKVEKNEGSEGTTFVKSRTGDKESDVKCLLQYNNYIDNNGNTQIYGDATILKTIFNEANKNYKQQKKEFKPFDIKSIDITTRIMPQTPQEWAQKPGYRAPTYDTIYKIEMNQKQ